MSLSVTPSLRAAACVAASSSLSLVTGFRRTARRATRGTASFSNSSRFEPSSAIMRELPVTLPPGRAMLATSPSATGSALPVMTMGIVLVACFAALSTAPAPAATMMSTFIRTSSSARSSSSSTFHFAERYSMAIVLPSIQPNSRRPARKAARSGEGVSLSGARTRYPRRMRLTVRTTASPISRMGTSVEDDLPGSLAERHHAHQHSAAPSRHLPGVTNPARGCLCQSPSPQAATIAQDASAKVVVCDGRVTSSDRAGFRRRVKTQGSIPTEDGP